MKEYNMNATFFRLTPPKVEMKKIIKIERVIEERPLSEVYARIVKLNQYGNMRIKFTQKMNTNMNITFLNKTNSELVQDKRMLSNSSTVINEYFEDLMTIYVVPADNWDLVSENFSVNFINLTWQATNYSRDTLDFNITFEQPNEISPLLH